MRDPSLALRASKPSPGASSASVSRALALSVASLVIGAALGAGVVTVWAAVGNPTECVRSQAVTTLPTLTPLLIVNSPYGGYANGTLTTYANSSYERSVTTWSLGARNGSVGYLFVAANWTVWTTQRVGDPSGSCAGVFVYSEDASKATLETSSPENYTNDSQAPAYSGGDGPLGSGDPFPTGPFAPLYFNDSYSRFSAGYATCAGVSLGIAVHSTYLRFQLPFTYQGSDHTASITVDELQNYTYSFSAGGDFDVDDLSGDGGPGGGAAFAYLPCPG